LQSQRQARGWQRHLDGWQAGLLVVLLAGSAVVLAMPHTVEPREPPEPAIDYAALTPTWRHDDHLAKEAVRSELDVDIRAVGSLVRQYNRAAAEGLEHTVAETRTRLARATLTALRRSEQQLLTLRAYQLSRFLTELREWQRTGKRSEELVELGGDVLRALRRNRWCVRGRDLLPDEAVLRVLYKKRWNDITGATAGPFKASLDEDRVRYGFLLRHPVLSRSSEEDSAEARQIAALKIHGARLKVIERLRTIDPSYPSQLARGVVLYRSQRYQASVQAFQRHLDASPDGPHALRANGYLKAALEQAMKNPM
jgi:hypothetical protein